MAGPTTRKTNLRLIIGLIVVVAVGLGWWFTGEGGRQRISAIPKEFLGVWLNAEEKTRITVTSEKIAIRLSNGFIYSVSIGKVYRDGTGIEVYPKTKHRLGPATIRLNKPSATALEAEVHVFTGDDDSTRRHVLGWFQQ